MQPELHKLLRLGRLGRLGGSAARGSAGSAARGSRLYGYLRFLPGDVKLGVNPWEPFFRQMVTLFRPLAFINVH